MSIRPNKTSSNGKYHAIVGTFIPLYPDKFIGTNNPRFKSKLEYNMMRYLDKSPAVIKWKYEPFGIKYKDLSSNKIRTYYIDFVATLQINSSTVKKVWIEVKSLRDTLKPTYSKNKKMSNLKLEETQWIKNQCKWETAKKLAKMHGYEFIIITEDQLKF